MFEAWQQATENIENLLSEGDYVTWIKPVRYSHHQGSSVYLSVPNSFVKEWLEDHYLKIVTDALSAASGQTVTLDFIIRDDEEQQPISENLIIQSSNEPAATQIALPEPVFTNLNP